MRCRPGASLLLGIAGLLVSASAHAERPRDVIIPQATEVGPLTPQGLAPYNTLFLNRCASGCVIHVGGSNSIADTWQIGSTHTLTPWPYGDQAWNDTVACVKDVFSPFMVNVTDVDPGSANHFEVMVAGISTDLGMSSSIGGVAPGGTSCSSYANNALVFDFAKTWGNNSTNTCDAKCIEDQCSTIAQEIGHTWKAMDHVRLASDPMTYFGYSGRRYYQDEDAQCGSDCVNGVAPYGQTCDGTNQQSHSCTCGGQLQNSHEVVASLFGLGPGTPPTVNILSPKMGDHVNPGFSVAADPMDDSGQIAKVVLKVDNVMVSELMKGPWVFNAPDTLANGTHRVEVVAYDPHQTPGSKIVDVIIGKPCEKESDCPMETDVCVGGRCVPGSGVNGGLGTTCSMAKDCVSGQCASDGTNSYCVEECMVGQCPPDYGCLDTGTGKMYCWPGYDDGSGGGCGCQSSPGAPLGTALSMLVLGLVCRRRRKR